MESRNNETAAMLLYQSNPVVVKRFYVNTVSLVQIHLPATGLVSANALLQGRVTRYLKKY